MRSTLRIRCLLLGLALSGQITGSPARLFVRISDARHQTGNGLRSGLRSHLTPAPAARPISVESTADFAVFTFPHQAGDGLAGARYIQRDYFQVTGRFLSVVRVLSTAAPGSTFTYDVEDQAWEIRARRLCRQQSRSSQGRCGTTRGNGPGIQKGYARRP